MGMVYALLAGIDAYPSVPLRGCVADIDLASDYLSAAIDGERLAPRVLRNGEATRAGIIRGFREHLGKARAGDTAFFWFSGHGSWCPVWPKFEAVEPSGTMQTLVCFDSRRRGVPDLLDKEIAILLSEIAANGSDIVTVFDCCHANGMTRGDGPTPVLADGSFAVRRLEPDPRPPDLAQLLPELQRASRDGSADSITKPPHLALFACATGELSYELTDAEGRPHGVFSSALIAELMHQDSVTYRELLAGARWRVENAVHGQIPMLYATDPERADRLFLGGTVRRPTAPMAMRYVGGRWEIDAGSLHGLTIGTAGDPTMFAVAGSTALRSVEVTEVHTSASTVRPLGWQPNAAERYPVVLTRVPVPPIGLTIDGSAGSLETISLLAKAVATAGPYGGPSTYLRLDTGEVHETPEITLRFEAAQRVVPVSVTGQAYLPPEEVADTVDARALVGRLEHVARWLRLRALTNPVSRLGSAIRIELLDSDGSATTLSPDDQGAIALTYRHSGGSWIRPTARIRLRNVSDRPLYCVLLDLTDSYRSHARLFSGDVIAPGGAGWADEGQPISFTLPTGRQVRPGAGVTDWLKVIASETEFGAANFELPAIGSAITMREAGVGMRGMLDRLGMWTLNRDAGDDRPVPVGDWATSSLTITTSVPAMSPRRPIDVADLRTSRL